MSDTVLASCPRPLAGPKTNQQLTSLQLINNFALRKLIEEWLAERGLPLPERRYNPQTMASSPLEAAARHAVRTGGPPAVNLESIDCAVLLLRRGQPEDQRAAAEAFKVLAREEVNRAAIARAGIFPDLVRDWHLSMTSWRLSPVPSPDPAAALAAAVCLPLLRGPCRPCVRLHKG